MLVYHPARESMDELCRKWDRNISQHYRDRALSGGMAGKLKWYAATAAMIVSPLAEIPRILSSDRISGWRARADAFLVLSRIRAYRARKMAAVLFDSATQTASAGWNRE